MCEAEALLHAHMQTHVDNSFGNSLAFTINNTYGTHVLLEACRMYGAVRRFVNVSTDEVYGDLSYGASAGLSSILPHQQKAVLQLPLRSGVEANDAW